jgi:hypothetical protein
MRHGLRSCRQRLVSAPLSLPAPLPAALLPAHPFHNRPMSSAVRPRHNDRAPPSARMRSCLTVLLLLTLLPLSAAAFAADTPSAKPVSATVAGDNTQVITDKKNQIVRVLIGGKEILTIDAEGVHVHGNLDYTGVNTVGEPVHAK